MPPIKGDQTRPTTAARKDGRTYGRSEGECVQAVMEREEKEKKRGMSTIEKRVSKRLNELKGGDREEKGKQNEMGSSLNDRKYLKKKENEERAKGEGGKVAAKRVTDERKNRCISNNGNSFRRC